MQIRTCRFCRKMYQGYSPLCPQCVEELDEKYLKVRNYLDRNSGTNVQTIAKETGVDERSLLFLIREGRLMMKGADTGVTCAKCGKPIESGRYCDDCKSSLVHTLESTRREIAGHTERRAPQQTGKKDSGSRIHVLKQDD